MGLGLLFRKAENKKFNLNEEELRPYFELSQVEKGVFGLATRLYGITFKENKEIPVYHPDVKAYEVFDKDGSFLAVLYTDFHPRAGKRSGAWMTSYKEQWIENGVNSRPHVSVTMNFTKPSAGKPALLTFSEVKHFSTRIRTRLARNVCQYHLFNHEWYQRILGFCWSFHHKLWKISPQKKNFSIHSPDIIKRENPFLPN